MVIPLILYTNQYKIVGDNMWKEILELVILAAIFIGVLGLTYFVTKKLGSMNKQMSFNKNMKIVEVISLMQGQYLYIVQVGDSYHLIGCTQKGNMNYFKEINPESLNIEEVTSMSFQENFMYFVKGKQQHDKK